MAYNETLAQRIRASLGIFPDEIITNIEENKMFGGLAFLYKGKMTVGILQDDLMVRVKSEFMEDTLNTKDVRPMAFTGKAMKEFVFVGTKGYETELQLQHWLEHGLAHAQEKLNEG
ncbi:TfoX/Sxy family protein [Lentiprolixibacter aurantiacus]|uniref:TfoX/Sxy family protein n=1 Tax=Lentiprolixibacter aurantiacus TaxID=2993939 RepID=A0AAE3SP69_9FLAO|nr:TfoX/Sxy family protein [Lentiprolixibacter aurantiacus]MCX2719896.1 TfoX/Sxy family protein [Lentiprolixibacter aurantiacus]